MNNYLKSFSGTIPDFLERVFDQFRYQPAYHALGQTLTYQDVNHLSAAFAAYLQNSGLQKGDRVAVQLPNLLQYPVVAFGVLRAGMVLVNVNPQYTARELKHQLNDSGAKLLVVLENFANVAATIIPETGVEKVLISRSGDLLSPLKRTLVNLVVKHVKKAVPSYSMVQIGSLRQALSYGSSRVYHVHSGDEDTLALIQYTGGTTGVSKGAMLSHKNLLANMLQIRQHLDAVVSEGKETYIAPLPLYHIYAFQFHMLSLPSAGALSVLIPDPRNIKSFVNTLKRFKFSGFLGINTLFASLLQNDDFKALDFSSLKSTSSGGMALTDDVANDWFRVTGCEVCEGFGMTEASPVICANIPGVNRSGTVGLPLPHTQVKVVDSDGLSLPQSEAGELWVKGPQVMTGYWQRPDETASVLTHDGWLRTGDIAVIETTGAVKIVDRLKDMIIVSGFNVYPNEIDNVLTSHPDIAESAVVGIADDKSGEAIKAFVVAAKEGLTAEAVKNYCREQLTAYKVPKEIIFTDQLPKSNVGKVLRRELQSNHTAA